MLKQLAVFVVVLTVFAVAGDAFADGPSYGWSISASPSDPFVNQTDFLSGVYTAYLWFACSVAEPAGPGGMAASEFDLCSSNPANVILAFTPTNGYLNAGGATNLLLAVGGCPTGPMLTGSILLLNNAPGQLCICPASNGNKVTVDCSPNPQTWDIEWVGLDLGSGADPCGKGGVTCTKPVSVEESSWGTIKSLYR